MVVDLSETILAVMTACSMRAGIFADIPHKSRTSIVSIIGVVVVTVVVIAIVVIVFLIAVVIS